jgi:hypothetical protein
MVTVVAEALEGRFINGDPTNTVHVLWAGISLHLADKLPMGRDINELAEVMIRSLGRAVASKPSPQPATSRVLEA